MAGLAAMEVIHAIQRWKGSVRVLLSERPVWLRWGLYYAIIVVLLLFGAGRAKQFIYFQF